jgi:ATP-dependent RNA helicase RhlE
MPEIPEQYIHRIGRTGRADASGTAISFVTPREEEMKIEVEMLMNMELGIEEFPSDVEISTLLIGPEKEKETVKFLMKKPKISDSGAFHEKSTKNKKINLGGPGKTKKKTGSVNRNLLRSQNEKRNKKK